MEKQGNELTHIKSMLDPANKAEKRKRPSLSGPNRGKGGSYTKKQKNSIIDCAQ